MRHANSVNKVLSSGNSRQLRRLTDFSTLLAELTALVRTSLPTTLQGQCEVINLRGSTLVLQTASPAWASQLRFYVPAMLSALTQHRKRRQISEIQIRVKPVSAPQPTDSRRKRDISSRTATLITTLAESTSHPRLKEALQHLASEKPVPQPTGIGCAKEIGTGSSSCSNVASSHASLSAINVRSR